MSTQYLTDTRHDGQISSSSSSSWTAARDATSASASTATSRSTIAVYSHHGAARGGGFLWKVHRTFMRIDTSGITTALTAASISIRGYSQESVTAIIVKSSQSDIPNNGDFDAITGWSSGADNYSNVTKYSVGDGGLYPLGTFEWFNNVRFSIALNSTALTDIVNNSEFKFCIMDYTYDLKNSEPSSTNTAGGLYFSDYTGTSYDPYLDYTLAVVATADNATFFGTNF